MREGQSQLPEVVSQRKHFFFKFLKGETGHKGQRGIIGLPGQKVRKCDLLIWIRILD